MSGRDTNTALGISHDAQADRVHWLYECRAASYLPPLQKITALTRAITRLDVAKFLLVVGWEARAITNAQHLRISGLLIDASKMLVGWKAYLEKNSRRKREKVRRVSDEENVLGVPAIVVAEPVDVRVPITVAVDVANRDASCAAPSIAPAKVTIHRILSGLNLIRDREPASATHQLEFLFSGEDPEPRHPKRITGDASVFE